jgi:hypothetical protein
MISPFIVFFITGLVCLVLVVKSQLPLWQAREKLRIYMPNIRKYELLLTLRMGKRPEEILDELDTPNIRALKQDYLKELEASKAVTTRIICILLVGFGAMLVAGIVEAILRGKP